MLSMGPYRKFHYADTKLMCILSCSGYIMGQTSTEFIHSTDLYFKFPETETPVVPRSLRYILHDSSGVGESGPLHLFNDRLLGRRYPSRDRQMAVPY